ncbi:MAG TPA: PQQ-dependent sugar dehydrogenase [Anaerolineales bacterium]
MNRFSITAVLASFVLAACAPGTPKPAAAPTQQQQVASPLGPTPLAASPAVSASPGAPSQAIDFPDPQRYAWTQIASGFDSPVDIQFPPDGSGRMFIVEQAGRIRIVSGSDVISEPFLDITENVNTQGNERGLLGLAFHPNYPENGFFFVNYTDRLHHNVIARFRVSADPDRAEASSETILLAVDDPFPNHNGGVLAFGPDGYLYAGLGDGGSANDPFGNGQNTGALLGKVLRLDVDGAEPYAIPPDNPFASAGGRREIWAYGLRNPWRLSFDRLNGDLYIADVGQNTWEEVDYLPAGSSGGANFGWNYREGAHEFEGSPPANLQLIDPVAEYSHNEGGCSITGGYVYRGSMPEWSGIYFYGDFCSGKLWGLIKRQDARGGVTWDSRLLYRTGASLTSFGQDPQGEVYFADRGGPIFRLEAHP